MSGFESCSAGVVENNDRTEDIIQHTAEELQKLKEDNEYLSEEKLDKLISLFNLHFNEKYFDSSEHIYIFIINIIEEVLEDVEIPLNWDGLNKIDKIFSKNNLAPLMESTAISKNSMGRFELGGTISRLTCIEKVETTEFTPQKRANIKKVCGISTLFLLFAG